MNEVIIRGAGFVGSSIAIGLAAMRPDLKITVIEKKAFKDFLVTADTDGRALALNQDSLAWLKRLNITLNIEYIRKVHVSTATNFGNTILANNNEILGGVVSADILLRELHKKIAAMPGFFRYDRKDYSANDQITICAEGSASTTRTKLGFAVQNIDYQQVAYIYTVKVSHPEANTAFERFLPEFNSSMALLPLGAKNYKLVILVPINDNSQIYIINNIQSIFGWRLGKITIDLQQPYQYRIRGLKALELVKKNTILVGNAAQTVSPVAAQGLNLGFADAKILCEIIAKKQDLNTYIERRKLVSEPIFNNCHLLAQYGSKLSSLGVWLFGISPYLQQNIVRMGAGNYGL